MMGEEKDVLILFLSHHPHVWFFPYSSTARESFNMAYYARDINLIWQV
jgi:hypothetical protein